MVYNSNEPNITRWWFKYIILCITFTCVIISTFLINEIIKLKQKQILGTSVSVIDKSNNSASTSGSLLKFFYEPVASATEIDNKPWLKEKIAWTYNKDTLNDRFDYSVDKPLTTYRIVALGDSFTFGDHVNTADSWTEQLEDLLNKNLPCKKYDKYEVLNLGLRGFDIQYEIERYRLRGNKYNPDLVLWLLIWNDFDEINELLPDVTEQVMQEQKENPTVVSLNDTKVYQSTLEQFQITYPFSKRSSILSQFMAEFYTMYNGPIVLSTFINLDEKYKNLMKSWANQGTSTYFFDQLPNINADTRLSLLDGHPSPEGHKKIAESLLNYIRSNNLLICN